ncbi:hypothetical protein KR026_003181 [Drosophila bipectinata]|nr:hypothetical protein KR026_003181 [Drosophila bipectinata]
MICLSRLGVLNLSSVWPPTRFTKYDEQGRCLLNLMTYLIKIYIASTEAATRRELQTHQRPLQCYTKRGYIKWFGRMSHCRHVQGRMYP